jgi:hypothetical protein
VLIRADDSSKISNSLSCSALVAIPLMGQLLLSKYIVSPIRERSHVGRTRDGQGQNIRYLAWMKANRYAITNGNALFCE